jgi:large repetitive protein
MYAFYLSTSRFLQRVRWYALVGFLSALVACGGGSETPSFSIGGQVSGLAEGGRVTLQNGSEQLTVSRNGAFSFPSAVPLGGAYNITVLGQSAGQTCSLAASSGAGAGINSNITSIRITCSVFNYTIAGSVSGLQGSTVTLINNGTDSLTVNNNGDFTFASPVAFGGSYNVAIGVQPNGQTCSVSAGAGSGINANVGSVAVICSTNTFSINGNVSGASNTVTLSLNGGNFLSLATNGSFGFTQRIAFGGNYNVALSTNPIGQTCTVNNGLGNNVTADVINIAVLCSTNTFTIGGNATGLQGTVTLNLNGGSPLSIGSNGSFTFATPVSFGGNYSVTVATQPVGQSCSVSNGSGSLLTNNVQNISISCVPNTFTLGGTSRGVSANNPVTLQLTVAGQLNLAAEPPIENIQATGGAFTFATRLTAGVSYSVGFVAGPERSCTLSNPSGAMGSANVTNIDLSCQLSTFPFAVGVSGLTIGETLTLSLTYNNDGTGNKTNLGDYGPTGVNYVNLIGYGTDFSLVVVTPPPNRSCTVTNGTGKNVTSAPPSAIVSCSSIGPN